MKTKNFNLELAKAGKKFQTKLGNPARIITITTSGMMIVGVKWRRSMETAEKYNIDGTKWHNAGSLYDLEMVKAYNV